MTDDVVAKAITAADTTFEEWKQTDYQTRSQLLYTVAGLLRAKRKDLAKILKHDLDWDAAECLERGLVDEII